LIDKPAQVERDERAPDWTNAYNVEDLKRITTLFERHDEGLVHGPFDGYSAHDAATDLRTRWLKLGLRDDEGAPGMGLHRPRTRPEAARPRLHRGRMTLSPGKLQLHTTHDACLTMPPDPY
jgi:hypothetical protein